MPQVTGPDAETDNKRINKQIKIRSHHKTKRVLDFCIAIVSQEQI